MSRAEDPSLKLAVVLRAWKEMGWSSDYGTNDFRASCLLTALLLAGHFEEKQARRDRSIDRVATAAHGMRTVKHRSHIPANANSSPS